MPISRPILVPGTKEVLNKYLVIKYLFSFLEFLRMSEQCVRLLHSFIHQIFTYRTYYMSGIVVGAEDIPVKKLLFLFIYFRREDRK